MLEDWLDDEWPGEVVDDMRRFSQGDLIERPPMAFIASPGHPVTSMARQYGDVDLESEVFEFGDSSIPPYGMITTETCDIVEGNTPRPRQPFVLVAPVYNFADRVDGNREKMIRNRRISYLVHLPADSLPDGLWAVDLRLEVPLEKGVLVGRTPIEVLASDEARRDLADVLAARRDRPVVANKVHDGVVRPLRRWLENMKESRRELLLQDAEVRLAVSGPRENPDGVALLVVTREFALTDTAQSEWSNRYERMREKATEHDVVLLPTQYLTLKEMSALQYIESMPVDTSFG